MPIFPLPGDLHLVLRMAWYQNRLLAGEVHFANVFRLQAKVICLKQNTPTEVFS